LNCIIQNERAYYFLYSSKSVTINNYQTEAVGFTSFEAMIAKRPIMHPDKTPTTGPINVIIRRGWGGITISAG